MREALSGLEPEIQEYSIFDASILTRILSVPLHFSALVYMYISDTKVPIEEYKGKDKGVWISTRWTIFDTNQKRKEKTRKGNMSKNRTCI